MQLVGPEDWPFSRRLKRCEAHAYGPVNDEQIAQAQAAKVDREAREILRETPTPLRGRRLEFWQ